MRKRGKPNRGSFRKGPDRRRHTFTPEERARGGRNSWLTFMAQFRMESGFPLPSPELRERARQLIESRRYVPRPAAAPAAAECPF